ncbi:anthocyanidin 3-O-glucoside 2 -O-glucosyltransferase-like [Olea europaea subsp. europaea]|uniref:Glycosyltransferase n=1 Tax=Olea europaea subsp. europaea TaxID=158383 RepID=A0A8S0U7G5_OLEEU|nr:anthocyanidin 3-O-glucoside 2 -O-glucosyltransferase-like [Olea europaea subsp. europaea]
MCENSFKFFMYPWFAMGHLTSFIHLSNKLAEKGHKIFFILPTGTQSKLEQFNLHPEQIRFIPITVPHVEGLPSGTETTADISFSLNPLLRYAMDLTQPMIESFLQELKPHFVFFDFTHWLPSLTHRLGIKSINYFTISPAAVGYLIRDVSLTEAPKGFPPSSIKLYAHEMRALNDINNGKEFGCGITFVQRILMATNNCDAIAFKTCTEMEGPYSEFLEIKFKKPVILAGPVLPEPPTSTLDDKWAKWFNQFKSKTVIFCAFGSETRLRKDQFQELLLGLELTGFPFLAALKPPIGTQSIEQALPEGFTERIQKQGIIHEGWIQQQLILGHPSIGCFVTHCGLGSLSESMVNDCQLVLMPHAGDQIINARLMGGDLRIGVEVEKGHENGLFTKEGVVKAVRAVMEDDMAGTSASRPRTFKKEEAELEEEERSEEESEESSKDEAETEQKGTQGIIQVENPNLAKPKNVKARDINMDKTTELSRRERGEIEKQKAHERYMKLQEQGKTDQAQKDLERLALIRQKRADAAKKREEEKTGNFLSWPILIAGPLCFLFGIFSGILFAFSRPCSQRAEEVGSSQTCSKN